MAFIPPVALEPGETVLEDWFANQTQDPMRAVGGRMTLTDRRLVFTAHALDAATGGFNWAVPLGMIADVGTSPVDLRHFFGGGLRRRLRITLRDGQTHLFVVNRMGARIAAITNALRRGGFLRRTGLAGLRAAARHTLRRRNRLRRPAVPLTCRSLTT